MLRIMVGLGVLIGILVWVTTVSLTPIAETEPATTPVAYQVFLPTTWHEATPTPTSTPTPRPRLFVGMGMAWDGSGYIRTISGSYDVGVHEVYYASRKTDEDTMQFDWYQWYDPNPKGFSATSSSDYYSVSTGRLKATSRPDNPDWKWGYPRFLPYDMDFRGSSSIRMGGQTIDVAGPTDGYTAFGQAVRYWELTNRERMLLWWDGISRWKQYIEPRNAVLRYSCDGARLLIYSSVRRTWYLDDNPTSETVHYITLLTLTNGSITAQLEAMSHLGSWPTPEPHGLAAVDDSRPLGRPGNGDGGQADVNSPPSEEISKGVVAIDPVLPMVEQ